MGIKLFSEQEQEQIKLAIKEAENQTSGEIRIFIEEHCNEDVLDRAAFHFKQLDMHKTDLRNGVLIYLATADRKFAIIGDAGINKVTGSDFWDEAKNKMLAHFKENNLTAGLIDGIHMVGEALKKHFPYNSNDKNELPDDIAFN
jgi:uncharacterized membrane protein